MMFMMIMNLFCPKCITEQVDSLMESNVVENYKDTHRNKPENYFLGLLTIMGVLLI
jgi:hypothetical protein